MKKLLAMILAVALMLTLAACGNKDNEDPTPTSDPTVTESPTDEVTGENTETPTDEADDDKTDKPTDQASQKPKDKNTAVPTKAPEKVTAAPKVTEEPAPKTVGGIMKNAFRNAVSSTTDPVALAEKLVGNSAIPFAGMAMAVEPGYLNGFDGEITGFTSGATFGPMIGTIPFVGYVFRVDGSVDSFKTTLRNNANLRWNICTSADEMVIDSVGNTVFFLMCPTTFEE